MLHEPMNQEVSYFEKRNFIAWNDFFREFSIFFVLFNGTMNFIVWTKHARTRIITFVCTDLVYPINYKHTLYCIYSTLTFCFSWIFCSYLTSFGFWWWNYDKVRQVRLIKFGMSTWYQNVFYLGWKITIGCI